MNNRDNYPNPSLTGGIYIRYELILASSLENNIMSGFVRHLTAATVAASVCMVPTAAIAAPVAAPVAGSPASVATAPSSAWLTLSAMTSSSAASAASAAQDGEGPGFPPIAPLVEILATIATGIYILVKDDNGHLDREPVSPS
jgi:hypothetical protein